MKTKLLLPLTAFLALASVTISEPAHAIGKHQGYDIEKQERTPMILTDRAVNKLGLSEEQQEKIQALYDEAKVTTAKDREQLDSLKKQWKTLAREDVLNTQELEAVANQQAQIKAKLKVKRLQLHKAVHSLLSEDQQAMVAKLKHKKRKGHRRHQRS